MRTLLAVCAGLVFAGSLAAQSKVPRDQCLGGKLVAIQPDSISLQFNQKITLMRVAPDAEIWRRGVDLESIHQLALGDDIYAECIRAGDSDAVMASVVAAVEKGDSVRIEPHHVAEYRVCGGYLVAIAKDAISVKSDDGVSVIRVNANTEIWQGEILRDTAALKLGDVVSARATVAYPSGELIADEVTANVAITESTIVAVRSDRIVVNEYPGADKHSAYPRGHATVLFDAHTNFRFDGGNLEKGRTVRAVGLDLGHHTFRASTIIVER